MRQPACSAKSSTCLQPLDVAAARARRSGRRASSPARRRSTSRLAAGGSPAARRPPGATGRPALRGSSARRRPSRAARRSAAAASAHVELEPRLALLAPARRSACRNSRPAGVELREDLGRRLQRLELVLGVERPGRFDDAVELEVGQQRLDDQRADVVRRRTARRSRRRTRSPSPSTSSSSDATACGVGVSPKVKFSSTVTSSPQASSSHDARLPVAPGAADLLGVVLQGLGQVVVVDVADVATCRSPCRTRSSRRRSRRPTP